MGGIVVTSPSAAFEERIGHAFGSQNGCSHLWRDGLFQENLATVVTELVSSDPDVVAVGPDLPLGAALALTRALDEAHPEVVVVLVAEPSRGLLERAIRAGARDVIAPDAPDDTLRGALEAALDAARRRRAMRPAPVGERDRRIVAVLSPKGGVGKTTMSTNLAFGLARLAPGEVVVVDLDLQFGDVASAYRLAPEQSFTDVSRIPELDSTALKVLLMPHPRNFFVLAAPDAPALADAVTADHVRRVVELLADEFRYVIVDTGSGIDEPTLAVLDRCTDFVLVTSTDVPSVRATRKSLDTLDLLRLVSQRRHFVVNRADARVGLSLDDIESTVGLPIDVAVPSSRVVPVSLNQGVPVLESDARSAVGRALGALVERFAPGEDAASPKPAKQPKAAEQPESDAPGAPAKGGRFRRKGGA